MNEFVVETRRQLNNLLRIGTVSEVDLPRARCRVQSDGNLTGWLPWLNSSAGQVRSWHAPSPGEQVLLLALSGELTTAFVLPGIFSDAFPAPMPSRRRRQQKMRCAGSSRTGRRSLTNPRAAR